jgi:hypothetical protein
MDDEALSVWLRCRERADWRARSAALTQAVVAGLPRDRAVQVLDLATGAGSNLRYLAPHLPARQRWRLIDRSPLLLSDAVASTRAWATERGYTMQGSVDLDSARFSIVGPHLDCHIETHAQDLGTLDSPSMFSGRDLVTASALLDLVSESWLQTLASGCRAAGASALFTITYDGRFSCGPAEPEDERVRALMNAHQRRDKGLGGAAQGPDAAACALRCFADEGYDVMCEPSDWVLGPDDAAMQRTLVDGWAEAASEVAPEEAETFASWRLRRLAHVDVGISRCVVGHRDIAALLPRRGDP